MTIKIIFEQTTNHSQETEMLASTMTGIFNMYLIALHTSQHDKPHSIPHSITLMGTNIFPSDIRIPVWQTEEKQMYCKYSTQTCEDFWGLCSEEKLSLKEYFQTTPNYMSQMEFILMTIQAIFHKSNTHLVHRDIDILMHLMINNVLDSLTARGRRRCTIILLFLVSVRLLRHRLRRPIKKFWRFQLIHIYTRRRRADWKFWTCSSILLWTYHVFWILPGLFF